MKITLLSLVLCLLCSLNMAAQGSDIGSNPEDTTIHQLSKKELRRRKVAKRNIHYNILGGPSYTPDFGALIGGSALVTFRMNPSDTLQKRSVLPMAVAVMFEGGLNLMVKPQLFFKNDKFRIFGKFTYKNTLENFYGIGYATNKHYERSDSTSEYRYSGFQINPWFLFRLGKSNFFAGPQIDLSYDKISEPAKYLVDQPDYKRLGGTAHGYSNFSSGVGFLLTYDSRDIPANAYKGIYLDFRGLMYQKFLGGDNNFYRLEVDYRQYKKVGNRKVIAWTAQTKNVFGDVPMNQYALSGTPFDLRGYYMGHHAGNGIAHTVEVGRYILVVLTCLAQLGRGDQVHGVRDLHGVLNALDALLQQLTGRHGCRLPHKLSRRSGWHRPFQVPACRWR